ncbi:transcriptional regulator [Zhongshania sp.]|uniref:transcriptional regulator n=1 Tax=Zhongshania sp. TaxID=1971902 RepID=UPI0035645A8B
MSKSKAEAPFAYSGLDRIFHEKARLGIVSSLVGTPDGLTFSDLKSLCGLTDGNLNRHMQVLEDAGYLDVVKGHDGRRPQTRVYLSNSGRKDFSAYLEVLEDVLRKAAGANAENKHRRKVLS